MADQKISQLTDGGSAQATDEYVVARSGANYRIDGASVAAAATSVGTLTSLTVTGDLTVDTNTLKVDSANNRVGIGTATPAHRLDVAGSIASNGLELMTSDGSANYLKVGNTLYIQAASTTLATIDNAGSVNFDSGTLYVDAANNRVGVGTASPSYNTHIVGTSSGSLTQLALTNNSSANNTTKTVNAIFQLADTVGAVKDVAYITAFPEGANVLTGGLSFSTRTSDTTPTEKMRLDSGGNFVVGGTSALGTAANRGNITVNGTSQSILSFGTNGSLGAYLLNEGADFWINNAQNGAMRFYTNGSERARIDASGNLGVGTTSPSTFGKLATLATSTATAFYAGTTTQGLYLSVDDSTKLVTYASSGTNAGGHRWNVGNTEAARITTGGYFKASNTGTYIGSTGTYHELVSDTASAYTVRMAQSNASPGSAAVALLTFTNAAPNDSTAYFLDCTDNAARRAYIRSNGGLSNYQSNNTDLSDARTKTDITPAASMWDKIGALEIVTYKYVDQTHDDVNVGVIAQQVEAVEPVWVDSDGWDKEVPEGEEPLKTVYTKDITFAAIKALQEAMARIEALEARLAVLEAGA